VVLLSWAVREFIASTASIPNPENTLEVAGLTPYLVSIQSCLIEVLYGVKHNLHMTALSNNACRAEIQLQTTVNGGANEPYKFKEF
jgi:hypothetical protein